MSETDCQLAVCHLGYQPESPKILTLTARNPGALPERIPFYLRQNCFRMPRRREIPEGFSRRFPCPYDQLQGELVPEPGAFYYQGELRRRDTAWGTLWQADFSDFQEPGSYQIETDWQVSVPFKIGTDAYQPLLREYLTFLGAQRCGCEVFGVHPACHLDDGILDSDHSPWPATGGWHDAGDFRKWLAFTQCHLETLALIKERLNPAIPGNGGPHGNPWLDEIAWGNRFFHAMIRPDGQVFEDLGGGSAPPGSVFTYDQHWWFENHPGCYGGSDDNRYTDNRPGSGDERLIRTAYNPQVQFTFVLSQCRAAAVLPETEGSICRTLAEKAWCYGISRGHDQRTLFLAVQLRAALELLNLGSAVVTWRETQHLAERLLQRQETRDFPLTGYFLEQHAADGYRSMAFNTEPAMSLLRLCEMKALLPPEFQHLAETCRQALNRYLDGYLLADAGSNPFGLTPFGVYLNPPQPDRQSFRPAGNGCGVRTFIHPFNAQGIVHGTASVLLCHAHLLAHSAQLFGNRKWRLAAERLIQWNLGHNPLNRSLYVGLGYRQPIGYSFRLPQLPAGMLAGFIGRPDDTPYLEESNAIEWNTLEYWSIPTAQAAAAAVFLEK